MNLPLVAIVGSPNIGKSTLFNRLVGWRKAIVTDESGVTRDRNYGEVRSATRPFRLVDTGGLTPSTETLFSREIEQQAEEALTEASCLLLVIDARSGPTAVDREVAAFLRKKGLPIILVANKIDTPAQDHLVNDLYDLGLGQPVPISAEHGRGIENLVELIVGILNDKCPFQDQVEEERPGEQDGPVRVAIVGRPNVGKSSILNRLLGSDRVLVSDTPGTTRDSIDTLLEHDGRSYLLIDTAGIRRKGKVRLSAEATSVVLARKSIDRADVAILVLDGSGDFAAQDAHIAGYINDAHKPMVVAVNKWDIVERREQSAKDWAERVKSRLKFARELPVALVSAKTGQRVIRLLDHVDKVHDAAGIRVPTPDLNRWLEEVARKERHAPAKGKSVRLYYATQIGIHPPRIIMFCNNPENVHFSLKRFLMNSLRERFGFGPAPIKLEFRRRR